MAFFVPENLEENQSQNKNRETNDKLHLIIIAMSKKMNMSFEELNQFRVKDFLETFDIFTGKSNRNDLKTKKEPRKATQKDIDIMMGRR
jgi:hypothetical protein